MTPATLTPPTPANEGTRREFLAGAALTALLLAGCGSETEPTAEPRTRTVKNRFGTFQVPTDPRRVVGLEGRRDFETAIALGLGIVGVGSNALFADDQIAPFIDFDISRVEIIEQTEPDLERIAALRPDLILTRASNIEELRDPLARLAPLVPVDDDGVIRWRPDLEQTARTLGRTDRLAPLLDGYDRRLARVKDRHAARIADATVAVVQFGEEGVFYASGTDGFYLQAQTVGDLGGNHLPFLDTLTDEPGGSGEFSAEQTSRLEPADAILVIVNSAQERREVERLALWRRLPAVRADRVVFTDFRTNYGSVYAAGAALDLLDRLYATLA
jgi:iron complex transport system substrate-binding protein